MTAGRADGSVVRRRIVVIEDESMVLMLLEDMLQEIGCEVVGAFSRFEDAARYDSWPTADAVILDMNLHGKLTYAIAEQMQVRNIPCILSTGYAAQTLPPAIQNLPVLRKPFQRAALEQALKSALGMKK